MLRLKEKNIACITYHKHPGQKWPEAEFTKQQVNLTLESSVEREKDVQGIDVHREFERSVVTLLVMSIFSDFLGALRACADFRDSTEDSRLTTGEEVEMALGERGSWLGGKLW